MQLSDNVVFLVSLFLGVVLKDKMDAIMCVTMATNLAGLRHFYSHGHHVDRQNLVRNCDSVTLIQKCIE